MHSPDAKRIGKKAQEADIERKLAHEEARRGREECDRLRGELRTRAKKMVEMDTRAQKLEHTANVLRDENEEVD